MRSAHQPRQFTPLTEFDSSVVSETHYFGYVADGDQGSIWSSGNLQQKLVLLRLQASRSRSLFAELQEPPDFAAELSEQSDVIIVGNDHRQ